MIHSKIYPSASTGRYLSVSIEIEVVRCRIKVKAFHYGLYKNSFQFGALFKLKLLAL